MKSRQDFAYGDDYTLYLKTVFMSAALHSMADNDDPPEMIALEASEIADAAIKHLDL